MLRRMIQDKGRAGKLQVLEFKQVGNKVISTWGQMGGAMQSTTNVLEGVNVGKSNEKGAADVASEWLERQILKKSRQGYYEVDLKTNKPLKAVSTGELDFNEMPKNLRFFKPQNSMNAHCQKLLDAGVSLNLRKRNGMMHSILIDDNGNPHMYSLNVLPTHKDEPEISWLERYPLILESLSRLSLPPRTILLGEVCTAATGKFLDDDGLVIDDFQYVSTIVKSHTDLALQKQQEGGYLSYCIWDIPFLGSDECRLQTMLPRRRFSELVGMLKGANDSGTNRVDPYVSMPEIVEYDGTTLFVTLAGHAITFEVEAASQQEAIMAFAKEKKWEGYVIIDPNGSYEEKAYNFHGKPERPAAVCKNKAMLEVDVIVRWDADNDIGQWGKGAKSVGVGSVFAYLWDPEKEEEVFVGKVGGGLSKEQVTEFADPDRYPKVWRVEFAEWTKKGMLWQPVFLEERDDKSPEECGLDQKPESEDLE